MRRIQFRARRSRPVAQVILAASGITWLSGLWVPIPATASSTAAASTAASPSKGSTGSFTFSGAVSGTLKVPSLLQPGDLPGCTISPSQAGTDVITWDSIKLKQGGKSQSIRFVDLQLQVSKFGQTYSMRTNSQGSALGAVFFSTNAPYQWATVSGTITTTKGGKSGSVTGELSAGKSRPGSVTIKGSWGGCGTSG
jgi:hypothetical protein